MAKGLTASKAKRILEDGTVRGKALTEKQKKFFGAVAGGATPLKKLNGGWLDKFGMGGSLPGASGMMYSRNSGSSAMSPPNLTKAQDGFYKHIPEEVLKKERNFHKGFYKDTGSQDEGTPVPGSPGLINLDTVMYGTPEYKKAYEEGTFADVPNQLDEVVMYSGVDYEKYPYYNDLSAEQRKYFNDDGPIGRGVRRAAYTKRGLAEDTYDVVNPLMYGMLGLAGGMAAGPSIATLGRAAAPYVSRYALNPIQKALSYKPLGGPVSIGNVVDVGSAAYAGYATPEAYDKFKENPNFDTGTDLALTAMDLVPFSEIFTGGKNIKNLYNKGKNLFTKTPTPAVSNAIDASIDPGIRKGLANLNDELGLVNTTSSQIRASEKFNKNWFNHPDVIKKTEQMLNQPSRVRADMSEVELLQDINMYNTMLDKTPNLPVKLQNRIKDNLKDLKAGLAKRNLETVQQKGRFTEVFDENNLNHQDMGIHYDENPRTLGLYKGGTNQASVHVKRIKEKAKDVGSVITHEDLHAITVGKAGYTDEATDILNSAVGKDQDWWLNKINTTKDQKTRQDLIDRLEYLARPQEIHARVHELRKAFNLKPGQEVSPSKIEAIMTKGLKGETPVDEDFFRLLGDKENFRKIFNKLPAFVPAAVGLGAASQNKNGGNVPKAQDGYKIPTRQGVRKNADGSESTHLMKAEQLEDGTWVAFPSLFQNEDGKWMDMSGEKDWMNIYNEALNRGEVIEFGDNKESAIKFGEGSWKSPKMKNGGWLDKYQDGGSLDKVQNLNEVDLGTFRYVKSEDDPRYKAFQDSSQLYNKYKRREEAINQYGNWHTPTTLRKFYNSLGQPVDIVDDNIHPKINPTNKKTITKYAGDISPDKVTPTETSIRRDYDVNIYNEPNEKVILKGSKEDKRDRIKYGYYNDFGEMKFDVLTSDWNSKQRHKKAKNKTGFQYFQDGGVIEDNRGQWAHPGKVTKINSNNITMKGVNYPVLGISDTGDKKMMQPGKDYKFNGNSVTEYPMAQEGAGVNKEGVKQYKWFKNYMRSPKYKERLKKEFPDYSDNQIGQEVKSRLENVMQTRVGFLPRSSDISTGVGGVQGVYNADEYPGAIMLRPEYSASTSDALFKPGNYLSGYNTIPLHEWSHAADDGGNRMPQSTTDLMLSKMKENSLGISKDKYYYTRPTEYLGRMQPLRYLMQQEGLYDAGTQDFTKEDLENAKQNKTIKNNQHFQDLMKNVKSDEDFIELMNKVASVNQKDNSRTMMAKNGNSLVELDQLTNFTNYNTPQPGGWLDKY